MFSEIFKRKKLCPARLLAYGFTEKAGEYRYTCPILQDTFLLTIAFDRYENVNTTLLETDTDEEYTLYKTNAPGTFVGQIREEIFAVLQDVANRCCSSSHYKQEQTLQLLAYAACVYGDEPEFLWERTPGNGILRRKDSGKWYAALLTIPKEKLGLSSNQVVEVINLHGEPETVTQLLTRETIYPGWHMNKKSWYTVILDGSVENEELFALLRDSYRLAKK